MIYRKEVQENLAENEQMYRYLNSLYFENNIGIYLFNGKISF